MTKYEEYIAAVRDRKIITCDRSRKAVLRHLFDLERMNKKEFNYIFEKEKADLAIRFIEENLVFYEGQKAGQSFLLEPFQAFIVASLFGWVHKETGLRRFRRAFIFVARGNGKSPLAAAVGLLFLLKDPGGQIYSIATDFKQASICFNHAKQFIQRNEKLSQLITVYTKALEFSVKASIFRPLSKSWKSFDGFNPSCAIADEISAMHDSSILSPIESALFKRPESLELMITTANYISPQSPGFLEYEYATKVLDRIVHDDRYFSIIFELDKNDDWKNEKVYRKANPASFVDIEELVAQRNLAMNRKEKEREFRTKNLNQWLIGSQDGWMPNEKFLVCEKNYKQHKKLITEDILKDSHSAIGADFSDRRDLSVYTIAFYLKEIDKIYLKHKVFIPEAELLSKEQRDSEMFGYWVREGFVIVTPGETQDRSIIVNHILADIEKYGIKSMAYDPQMSLEIIEKLQDKIALFPINQRLEVLSEPTKDFEEFILSGRIIDANPVMRWCVSNARRYTTNKLVKITKVHKDSPQRIDLVISSILAVFKLRELINIKPNAEVKVDFKKLSKAMGLI
ncbi:TPA: terminase large subunit [Candidatus Poribacteria bacterium]|nr:terminase large subunit [Candidatus Poribacteria bacterium]